MRTRLYNYFQQHEHLALTLAVAGKGIGVSLVFVGIYQILIRALTVP